MTRQYQPKAGFWIRLCVVLLYPLDALLFRIRWRHLERMPSPESGGVIIAMNHVSQIDTILMARLVWQSGRVPRFMIKSGVFAWPVIGRIMRGAGQIPVYRGTTDASQSLREAVDRARARRGDRDLPRGHDDQGPGELADGRQDRHRAPRPAVTGHPGRPDRTVGCAQEAAQVRAVATGPPAHGAGLGRRAAGPVQVPRRRGGQGAPARGHRRDHGRGTRPGRRTARRTRAGRVLRA